MVNVCFYISDYGYGHASRSIATIRRMLKDIPDIRVFVKTDTPYQFVHDSLPDNNVKVIDTKNDIGIVLKEKSLDIDRDKTLDALSGWVASWDRYIRSEMEFCRSKDIGLILTDITPQPFIVGSKLGIPGIAISNFTWHYIFDDLFKGERAVDMLKDAYEHADMALILPFNEEMSLFKDMRMVSLVSRKMTRSREDMRARYGIADNELVIYMGTGRSMDPSFIADLAGTDRDNIRFLVSSNVDIPLEGLIKIPAGETETQDYIAMCDLVVTKTGYSTVSEAIGARVPILVFKREGFKEDGLIAGNIQRLGIGREITEMSIKDGSWIDAIGNLDRYRDRYHSLEERFIKDGAVEVVNAIKEVVL